MTQVLSYLNSFSSQYEQFASSSAFAQSFILSHLDEIIVGKKPKTKKTIQMQKVQ